MRKIVRLPEKATLNPQEAQTIAKDPGRLNSSYHYWRTLFADSNENVFDAADTPAMRLAKSLADDEFSNLLPKRSHLTEPIDLEGTVTYSGCLVSAEEIAKSIRGESGTNKTLFEDLRAFATAALSPRSIADSAQVARGIRAARELYDVSRRFSYCQANSKEYSVPFAELLSLYRTEGALSVTPPEDSFEHGPLIDTRTKTDPQADQDQAEPPCRVARVSLFDQIMPGTDDTPRPGRTERPGFNLVYRFRSTTDASKNDVSLKFDLLYRNIVVIGGLDTIQNPRLSPNDELMQFMRAARKGPPIFAFMRVINETRKKLAGTRSKFWNRQRPPKTQQEFLDDVATGLAMAEIEQRQELPSAEELLESILPELSGLIDVHRFETKVRSGHTDVHLLGDRYGTDTYNCLRVQARWYASRMRPHTLVAQAHRTEKLMNLPRFSPFVTYLRFHAGDAVFMGVLLRTITQLDKLDKVWEKEKSTWGNSFRKAFASSKWSKSQSNKLEKMLRTHWAPKVPKETAWRHIGLIDAIKRRGGAPTWLKHLKPIRPDPRLEITANVARQTIEAIANQGLIEAVNLALEFTPISKLVSLKMVPIPDGSRLRARWPLANAHSFERKRLTYEDAAKRAALKD